MLSKRESIIYLYASLADSLRRKITLNDMVDNDITVDTIKYYFRNLTRLEEEAREEHPDMFHDVPIASVLNEEQDRKLLNSLLNKKRYIVTTAVLNCKADPDFLSAMNTYCDKNDADILTLITTETGKKALNTDTLDNTLLNTIIVTKPVDLNTNISLSNVKINPKNINPLSGLSRTGKKKGSIIYPAPKQFMKAKPVANEKLPHCLMTTGSITLPHYDTRVFLSDRRSFIAEGDHVLGALIVEVQDSEIFHFRQIQWDFESKCFVDLGIAYKPNGETEEMKPAAFVLGDWHSGQTDPTAIKAWKEVIETTKVEKLILHDVFDGSSINHHEEQLSINQAIRAKQGKRSLEEELLGYCNDLQSFFTWKPVNELIVVKSNHDEFLNRYLQKGMYTSDPENHRISLDLAAAMIDGHDPLVWFSNKQKLKHIDKITWLERDEDYEIAGIQCGAHGDLGANGSRGSVRNMENAYTMSITGHTHTPEILRDAWSVGTSTLLRMGYNRGPSSWIQSSCLVYENGSRQLINSIQGLWKLTT